VFQDTRSLRDKEVWQFTHEDVKNEIIHFVAISGYFSIKMPLKKDQFFFKFGFTDEMMKDHQGSINDSFSYKLVAPGIQPAVGVFNFSLILQVLRLYFFNISNAH